LFDRSASTLHLISSDPALPFLQGLTCDSVCAINFIIIEETKLLANPNNVRFADLLAICRRYLGKPRISGSHHIFKTPWQGDPRLNLQRDGSKAKPYQVRDVVRALKKLQEEP